MKNILIAYFSGVGNTRLVAEKIRDSLKNNCNPELFSVEYLPNSFDINAYDAIVLGFPTVHTYPSSKILQFIEQLQPATKSIPAWIYTTCGLYTSNTLRIFAKRCVPKNIIPIFNQVYRCAATDGILLVPWMHVWSQHERHLDQKIEQNCRHFYQKVIDQEISLCMPRFRLYSILNYPNHALGRRLKLPVYLHKRWCVKCKICITHCPAKALAEDGVGYPVFFLNRCLSCYRCIHHCPKKALSLFKHKRPQKVLAP